MFADGNERYKGDCNWISIRDNFEASMSTETN